MRSLKLMVMSAVGALLAASPAAAEPSYGTPDEAKALVVKAIMILNTEIPDRAISILNDPSGATVDRDLYVFVLDLQGKILAQPMNKALVGRDITTLKDADGKFFAQEFLTVARTKGEGWVDYKWPNPVTKKIEAKSSFVKKAGDFIVGCGVYKP